MIGFILLCALIVYYAFVCCNTDRTDEEERLYKSAGRY